MGILGNLLGATFGAGAGVAGAHNAHLAELAINKLSVSDKKRVAEKVFEIGVNATGGCMNAKQFFYFFIQESRISQLNVVALALNELNIHEVPENSWMGVRNPFALKISSNDLQVNSLYLLKKHNLKVSIGTGSINIKEWVGQESPLTVCFS